MLQAGRRDREPTAPREKPDELWKKPGLGPDVTERSNAATEERLKSGHAVGGVSIVDCFAARKRGPRSSFS
jgi:hypothetical protein